MRISYWSSDVCSSDLAGTAPVSVRWLSGGLAAGWPPAGRCRLGQALFQPPCVGPVFVITGDAPNHSITAFSVERECAFVAGAHFQAQGLGDVPAGRGLDRPQIGRATV